MQGLYRLIVDMAYFNSPKVSGLGTSTTMFLDCGRKLDLREGTCIDLDYRSDFGLHPHVDRAQELPALRRQCYAPRRCKELFCTF